MQHSRETSFDVIVLGGGVNGLATAYHLLRRRAGRIAVLEQFRFGHGQGSSHGKSRITRSSYSTPKYVELIQLAHREEWPRWSQQAGQPLLTPTVGCFFGPGNGPYIESLQQMRDLELEVEVLEAKEARSAFPQFRFPDSERVIRDRTCAVIAAEQTMGFLTRWVGSRARLLEQHRVQTIERTPEEIRLHTNAGLFRCGRLVVTAGAWLGQLLPQLAPRLQVAQQHVGYFELDGEEAREFPVWVYAPRQGDSFYGLPQFGRPGVKVARHRTGAEGEQPDRALPAEMPKFVRQELQTFVDQQFVAPGRWVGYEPCLYTNTMSEDFLLDHHPEDLRLVIGSACSGHGFKFGPLTGRILCELLLDGRSSLPTFEKHRDAFRLRAFGDWPAGSPITECRRSGASQSPVGEVGQNKTSQNQQSPHGEEELGNSHGKVGQSAQSHGTGQQGDQ
jgi:sarcosine oxidase